MYLNTQKYRLFCSLIESLSRICPACVASVIVSGSPMIAPCKGIRIPNSEILEIHVCGTVEFWVLESGIQFKESEIPKWLESRFQVPLTKTGIQYQESGIHGIESRIQGCPGTLYMGREWGFAGEAAILNLGEALLSPPRPQYALTWWSRPAATWATRTSRVRCPSFVKNLVRP